MSLWLVHKSIMKNKIIYYYYYHYWKAFIRRLPKILFEAPYNIKITTILKVSKMYITIV